MIALVTATSKLQLTTGSAVTIDVHASYIDRAAAGTVGATGYKNTAISTATTTDIVASPAASTERNIKHLTVRNKHATTTCVCTVIHTDGTTAVEMFSTPLPAGAELTWTEGSGWVNSTTPTPGSMQVITAAGAGTYTLPAGVRAIKVECVAGGGAGGGVATAVTNSGAAGGGGSGAYSCTMITSPAASYAYVVGAGGTPGAAGANAGGNGVDTTFGSVSVCTAKGGTGGAADTVAVIHVGGAGGAGGLASGGVGDIKVNGEPGGVGLALAVAAAASGQGGNAVYGGGGAAIKAQGAGNPGLPFGSGGAGGCILSGGASVAGGAGGAGVIIVTEYR